MEWDAQVYQRRIQHEEEWASKALEHGEQLLAVEEQRVGLDRDARLRALEAFDAKTIQQKVWVEQRKAEVEVDYLEKVNDIKMRLFDLETSRMVLEEEANLRRLGYRADEIQARIAELAQQREAIRQANQETTDAAVQAAHESPANRSAELVRDHNQRIFDSIKRQAEGVFDALLTKSQSIWSAIGNAFKTAMLTAIKEVVTSSVARLLMQMFGGMRGGYASADASGGGWAGALGGFGALFGGAVPGFGGVGSSGAPGGTGGFAGPVSIGGSPGGIGGTRGGLGANLAGFMPGLKSLFGIGGSVQTGAGMATTWEAATMGQKLASIGHSAGFALAGGMLALTGLRRGGISGLGMTTAGGAMLGYKFGGPVGAAIGAVAGAAAGIVRLFVKGAHLPHLGARSA